MSTCLKTILKRHRVTLTRLSLFYITYHSVNFFTLSLFLNGIVSIRLWTPRHLDAQSRDTKEKIRLMLYAVGLSHNNVDKGFYKELI